MRGSLTWNRTIARDSSKGAVTAMLPKGCSPDSPDQIEQRLLEDMQRAELTYRQAVMQSRAAVEHFASLPIGHADGAHGRHQAARTEAAALEKYQNAVKAFSDWVLHGKSPGS